MNQRTMLRQGKPQSFERKSGALPGPAANQQQISVDEARSMNVAFKTPQPNYALDALAAGIMGKRVNWVLDLDFREFFTSLDHQWLEKFLEHRIADRRVLRLIQKWMAAGVIEDGAWTESLEGVPQGASASPLLANVYLHYVFDLLDLPGFDGESLVVE